MQITFTIPSIHEVFGMHAHAWLVVVAITGIALLASIVVEVIKRRHNAKQQEKMAKKAVAWLLASFTFLFSAATYFIAFAQNNATFLSSLPVVGQYTVQAMGVAWFIYNIKLNKWFQGVADVLGKWSKDAEELKVANTAPVPEAVAAVETVADVPNDTLLS